MRWSVVGSSVAGTTHIAKQIGCDDAFAYALVDDDVVVAAVADGAGSYSGTSALGAFVACQTIAAAATEEGFGRRFKVSDSARLVALVRELFTDAFTAIEKAAASQKLNIKALSTTLSIAIVSPSLSAFAQLGDGVVVVSDTESMSCLIPEPKGEYANETNFLTSKKAIAENLRIQLVSGVTAFALSTDGLRYKILELSSGEPYMPFFDAIWSQLESRTVPGSSLSRFLSGLLDDQTGDDKTLVAGCLSTVLDSGDQSIMSGSQPPLELRVGQPTAVLDFISGPFNERLGESSDQDLNVLVDGSGNSDYSTNDPDSVGLEYRGLA